MDKDILALISKDNSGFSKGQRLIAKYILENYDKAAFMTAGKLGKTVGVSESTVVRFAAELGFDGYPGMRKALQEMIRSRLTSVQRIEASKDMLDDKNILKSVMSDDIDKLQTTLEEIDQDTFNRVIDSIMGAKDIYIFASRTSRCLADFMAYYLGLLRPGVHLIDDNSAAEAYEQLLRIGEGDLFIGLTFPRYSSRSAKVMGFAKDRGCVHRRPHRQRELALFRHGGRMPLCQERDGLVRGFPRRANEPCERHRHRRRLAQPQRAERHVQAARADLERLQGV